MKTVEFETELSGKQTLSIPPEIASALPRNGKATVLLCIGMDPDDTAWRRAAYDQFLRDDLEEVLTKPQTPRDMPPLPEFTSGGARVDLANREALYDVMER